MGEFLEQKLTRQIEEVFAGLDHPVEVALFITEDGPTCVAARLILEEVLALSPLLSLQAYDLQADQALAAQYGVDRAPTLVFLSVDGEQKTDHGIRYLGVPSGNEFTTLINDLMLVSTRNSALDADTRDYLKTLNTPVVMQVFVTPTCPYCPRAVMTAHQLAMESSLIQAEAVDAWENPDWAELYGVSGVPHTVINHGQGNIVGSGPVAGLVDEIRRAVENAAQAA
jgi:glutaredoxin-like protein